MAYYAASVALGVAAGAAFAWIWLAIVPPGSSRRFWSAMRTLTREMLTVDETGAFFRLYGRLGRLLAPYVARNLGGTLAACLPMIAILLFLAVPVFERWDARAERVTLAPAGAAERLPSPVPYHGTRTAYCSSMAYCALLAALDFEVVELERAGVPYAVVRADHSDVNPLWPFLSDLEATFFAAFVLSMLAGLLWPRPSRSPS